MRRAWPSANCARSRRLRSAAGVVPGMLITLFKALEVPEEPVVNLADSADHGQMAVAVADVSLGAGDAGGQPLPVLHGNEPVLTAVPDLDRHPDVAEVKPPVRQLCRAVVPPALVARGERHLMGLGQPPEQVPVQHLRVDGRDEALQVRAELLPRGREDLLDALAQIEAGRLLVGEEQLKALDVGLAHPVVKVEALDPVGRKRSHRRDGDRHVWHQGRAPQRERTASGYAPDADPVVSERLSDGPDILSVRRHGVTGLRGRTSIAGAIDADETDALFLGVGDPPAVQASGHRLARLDQDRPSGRITGDLQAEFTPAADRYGPGLNPAGH